MTITTWLSLLGICQLGAMAPGPSLAVILRATLHSGRQGGVAAALAHLINRALSVSLIALGAALFLRLGWQRLQAG
ncbi:MAG: LysE family transporter [Haliea sp.]|jgi:threonine/homoserine/homoserine lactone efflux protein|nr:LysE family transporter [Haliea sp.]MDP4918332.1 LysE family transporter [Haliea sp.]MDP5064607.1 LysE family transporter [Haliea sp.]